MDERVELELELAADGPEGYRVDVRSAAGEETGRLLLDVEALLGRREHLQATVLASAVTSRGAVDEVGAPVRQVGEALFDALFDDRVYATYKASLALAAERSTQLRVVLRVQPSELASLPWEMMYDAGAGAYLCQREPLVRHVSVPHNSRPLTIAPPLRILGVVSAPRDLAKLDAEGERQRLEAALSPLGSRVSLRWARGGRWADVQQALIAEQWHALHFIGHGGFDHHQREGVLALEDDQGMSDLVGAERFSNLLTLQVEPLRLVLLNSCAGAVSAADDVFSSTAATLIRTGVSAVVAMQFAVSDPAAKAFAAGFYQAVAHNRSVAEAVRIGRIGIRGLGEETLEWVTPVLYLRGDDAALFEVLPGGTGPSPEEAALTAAAEALYESAMSHLEAGDFADAVADFDVLLRDREEDFKDALRRREEARRALEVSEVYDRAHAAGERGDWAGAVEGYVAVLALDPHHPHARERLDQWRRRQQVASLQEQLRDHVAAKDWPAAVSVADELQRLSPADSDPGGLATTARAELRGGNGDHGGGGGGSTSPRRLLMYTGGAFVALLLTVGIFWVWPDGRPDPPSPFQSAALYELSRHHFDPGACHVAQDRSEAPVLFDLDHTELVVCDGPDEAYTLALVCMGDEAEFESMRATLLGLAVDTETVSEPPAGRTEPWPYQMSYRDKDNGRGRVLWDDAESWCAALLRAPTDDLDVTRDHFIQGTGA